MKKILMFLLRLFDPGNRGRQAFEHFDFVSRFFAPSVGIPEDPVTGSAHCCLAPYWGAKLGKTEMTGFQCSGRGGSVRMTLMGDHVILEGHTVLVFSGKLLV